MLRLLAGIVAMLTALLGGGASAASPTGLSVLYQPAPYSQLQTFWIGSNGALRTVHKERNGRWHQAYDLTGPDWGIPNAPVASTWGVQGDRTEVFWVDGAGVVSVAWADKRTWRAPAKISPLNYFPAGAQLSAVWHPTVHQLMVFGIDSRGVLKMVWKQGSEGRWQTSADMSGPGFGAPGGAVSAIYQPLDQRVEAFAVGSNGAINIVWKSRYNKWAPAASLTPPGVAAPDAQLSALWYGPNNQIEVFWIDQRGAARIVWQGNNANWTMQTLTDPGFAAPGAPLSATYQPLQHQLEVVAFTAGGGMNLLWKQNNGAWKKPQRLIADGVAPARTIPRIAFQPEGNQVEAFYFDAVGQLWGIWKTENSAWRPKFRLTDIGGDTLIKSGDCTVFLQKWSKGTYPLSPGIPPQDYMMTECQRINGINAYCAARDAYPAVDLYENGTRKRLICVQRSREDTIGQQAEHIVRGVRQGLGDAFVAAAPYLGVVTEGLACVKGIVYACASLALTLVEEIDQAAGRQLPGVVPDAIRVARRAMACADGDYVECASLGQAGLKEVAGANIPAADIIQVGTDIADCRNKIFAACARLGQTAVTAAGIPIVYLPKNAASVLGDAQKCLIENDTDALADERKKAEGSCRALGLSMASAAGVDPSIVEAATKGVNCANGNSTACRDLGFSAARTLVPKVLNDAIQRNGERCLGSDPSACFDIAIAGASAAGLPTGDVAAMNQCARGNMQVCETLAQKMTGLPLGSALQTAQLVSRCVDGDVVVCIDLGRKAAGAYDRLRGTAVTTRSQRIIQGMFDATKRAAASRPAEPIVGVVTGRGLNNKKSNISRTSDFTEWVKQRPNSPLPPPPPPPKAETKQASVRDLPSRPMPASGVRFDGPWETRVQNGVIYDMTLSQDMQGRVWGRYDAGTISDGVVIGRTLHARWTQGGLSGTVLFELSADTQSFSGIWAQKDQPANRGTWTGKRPMAEVAAAPAVPPPSIGALVPPSVAPPSGALLGVPGAAPPPIQPQREEQAAVTPPPVVVTPPPPPVVAAPVVPVTPPPVVVLPQGQCPAATAVVSQQLNIREGRGADSKGGPVVGRVEGGTRVQCVACDSGWCQIAASNPNATVSRRYLEFELPQVAVVTPPPPPLPPAEPVQPPPPPPPVEEAKVEPQKPANADFSGEWSVRTSTGIIYQFRIQQNAAGGAGGGFSDQFGNGGQFSAQVAGDTLTLQWFNNQGYQGVGNFKMKADGKSFAGAFNGYPQSPLGDRFPVYRVPGTWESFIPAPPAPDDRIDYGGCAACGPAKPENPR